MNYTVKKAAQDQHVLNLLSIAEEEHKTDLLPNHAELTYESLQTIKVEESKATSKLIKWSKMP